MIKRVFILFLVNAFILTTAPLYALQPSSLEELIKEAKQNNPELLAAKKRWEASKARIPQAKSLDNPTIGFTFEKIPRGTLRLDKTMSEDRMLSINQMLPWFGKLPLKGKIVLVESQMVASEYKGKELEIIKEVKHAYHDLFMSYKETELDRQSLAFLETLAKIAEAKYIVGEIMQEDILKINLEIAKLSNNILNLGQEKQAIEVRLNSLLNRKPDITIITPDLEENISFSKDFDAIYRLTLENQPELLTFSYAIERNRYAKSLAKKSFFPDLMAGIVQRGITSGTIGPWDLMLAFSVPLWFWTKQRYEVKEAIANLEEAEAAYLAMKNKVLAETKDLVTKIEISKNKINLYNNTQIPLLEASIESSLSAYRSGKGDIMMLLDSERMLIETKMDYYRSLIEYYMNLADLERTVGIGLLNKTEVKK